MPALLALQDPRDGTEFLRLWEAAPADPDGTAQLGRFLEERGYLDRTRQTALGLLGEVLGLVRVLPDPAGAAELEGFLQSMAAREF